MTKLETSLLAQIKSRLAGIDLRASDKLAALIPVLRTLAAAYDKLSGTAKKTIAGLFPELAALIESAEAFLK